MIPAIENNTADLDTRVWYAVYTNPHKEYMVKSVLQSNGVEVYLPEIAMVYQRRDRRSLKPFFPQYMFARLEPYSDQMVQARWAPGVRTIVSSGGQPISVPDHIVGYIRRRLKNLTESKVPNTPFKKGEVIHVAKGPLEGLEAIFDSTKSSNERVYVLLNVMNRLVKTELNLSDLVLP